MALAARRARHLFHSLSSSPSSSSSLSRPPTLSFHFRSSSAILDRNLNPPQFRKIPSRPKTSGSGYSPLNDPSPNWSNRPPKETILLDGCDYEHWLIVMEFPEDPKPSEDEMINAYVKTLTTVLGSEEEAKKKIYSVCTTTYTGFGALISEELSYKVKGLPGVLWVLPDSYLDVPNKDYGGDLFVDGKVIHRPQYYYNERQPSRNRPRPRYDRRRETMQVERREPMQRVERREPNSQQIGMDRRDSFQSEGRVTGPTTQQMPIDRRDLSQGEWRGSQPQNYRDTAPSMGGVQSTITENAQSAYQDVGPR